MAAKRFFWRLRLPVAVLISFVRGCAFILLHVCSQPYTTLANNYHSSGGTILLKTAPFSLLLPVCAFLRRGSQLPKEVLLQVVRERYAVPRGLQHTKRVRNWEVM